LLGPERSSHSRLTLAQAFNSLGTTIGPWVGAITILSSGVTINTNGLSGAALAALRRHDASVVEGPFVVIAAALIVIAVVFWVMRKSTAPRVIPDVAKIGDMARLLVRPRVAMGVVAIFVYVGAEVYIGSIMANYLMQPSVLGVIPVTAGKMVSLYWGGAMIGRFIGSYILARVRPGIVLAVCASVACTLAVVSSQTTGPVAAYTLLAVGLFNSVMFPTIFALGTEQLGPETPNGSGLLIMAIVGGAVVPELTARLADHVGLATALFVPAACYLWILLYGVLTARGIGLTRQSAAA